MSTIIGSKIKLMSVFEWVVAVIKYAVENKFTGNIQINFFNGKIVNINKVESLKAPATT